MEPGFQNFYENHGHQLKEQVILNTDDFILMRHTVGVLRPVQNFNAVMQGDDLTGSSALPMLHVLSSQLATTAKFSIRIRGETETQKIDCEFLRFPAERLREKLLEETHANQRHLEQSWTTLAKSAALDPRWKGMAYLHEEEQKAAVVDLLKTEGKRAMLAGRAAHQVLQHEPKREEPKRRLLRRLSSASMEDFRKDLQHLTGASSSNTPQEEDLDVDKTVKDVVDRYFSGRVPVLDIAEDPLTWWKNASDPKSPYNDIYKMLSPLARKYLAIPGSNARIERVWSAARRLLSKDRAALEGEGVRALLPLRYNMESLGLWPPEAIPLV